MTEVEIVNSIYGRFRRTSKRRLDLAFDSEEAEIWFFQFLADRLGADLVLDVGANVGLYAIHSLSRSGVKRVVAVEASEATYRELQGNLSLQRTETRIEAHHVAVSDRTGTVQFYEYGNMAGHNNIAETGFVGERPGSRLVEVATRRLDDLILDRDRTIAMKIDVEGHECHVLDGARELLSHSNGFLQVEVFAEDRVAAVERRLKDLGFLGIGSIKNDHYFIHRSHEAELDELRAALFAETRRALVRLQDLNVMRRQALRVLREVGSEGRKVRQVLKFDTDPVLDIRKDGPVNRR